MAEIAPIPQRIIQYWHAEPVPLDVAELMSSWAAVNPNFEHVLVTKARARAVIDQLPYEGVGEALEKCWHPAMEADLVRLIYLHEWGGLYVDADHEAIAPVGEILSDHIELLLAQRPNGVYVNNFIGARLMHPLIRRTLETVIANIRKCSGDENLWLISGPGALTPVAREYSLAEPEVVVPWLELRKIQRVHNNLPYKENHWSGVHPLQVQHGGSLSRDE